MKLPEDQRPDCWQKMTSISRVLTAEPPPQQGPCYCVVFWVMRVASHSRWRVRLPRNVGVLLCVKCLLSGWVLLIIIIAITSLHLSIVVEMEWKRNECFWPSSPRNHIMDVFKGNAFRAAEVVRQGKVLASKLGSLTLSPRIRMVGKEKRLSRIILWLPHLSEGSAQMCVRAHTHLNVIKIKKKGSALNS